MAFKSGRLFSFLAGALALAACAAGGMGPPGSSEPLGAILQVHAVSPNPFGVTVSPARTKM